MDTKHNQQYGVTGTERRHIRSHVRRRRARQLNAPCIFTTPSVRTPHTRPRIPTITYPRTFFYRDKQNPRVPHTEQNRFRVRVCPDPFGHSASIGRPGRPSSSSHRIARATPDDDATARRRRTKRRTPATDTAPHASYRSPFATPAFLTYNRLRCVRYIRRLCDQGVARDGGAG